MRVKSSSGIQKAERQKGARLLHSAGREVGMRTRSDLCLSLGSPERSRAIPAGMPPSQSLKRLRISHSARKSRNIVSMSAERQEGRMETDGPHVTSHFRPF